MQKTKIGISVGLMGAAVYFMGLCGGAVASLMLAGYVLLVEENQWLKKCAVKSIALYLLFAVVSYVVYLIPDVFNLISSFLNIFGVDFYPSFIHRIADTLSSALSLIKILFYLGLGFKALSQGDIRVPVLDNLIEKYMV